MATYQSLTTEEKERLANADANLRAYMGTLGRLFVVGAVLDDELLNGVEAIADTLDPGEIIPDSSGLRGSVDLARDDWKGMITLLRGYMALDTPARRATIIDAAGANKLIGTQEQ